MTSEQLAALRAMPVVLENRLLPPGAPDARVIAELEAMGLVILISDGAHRWAATMAGQRELERWHG